MSTFKSVASLFFIISLHLLTSQAFAQQAFIFTIESQTTNENLSFYASALNSGGVSDSVNIWVDWGDGSPAEQFSDTLDGGIRAQVNPSHTYTNPGSYTIEITGIYPNLSFSSNCKINTIEQWGTNNWESMQGTFSFCADLTINATDAPDLTLVTSMREMFRDAISMNSANLNTWDVSSVTDMSFMFANAESFNQDLNSWNVSNVTNMKQMFNGAQVFNGDISSWDVSSVTDMSYMFQSTTNFNSDISNWNVSNVTDLSFMFNRASGFNQDISGWTFPNATSLSFMFSGASNFNQPLNNWDVSNVTDMSHMFEQDTTFNQPLNSWDVSSVTTMANMFDGASNFNQDISGWNVANVTTMQAMFNVATDFNQDISSWDVSSVTDMSNMFSDADAFNTDISSWNVSGVTTMANMFSQTALFDQPLNSWNVSSVTDMSGLFNNAVSFNQDISNWDVSSVTNMRNLFARATSFNQNISGWDVSSVTDMTGMFSHANSFNQDISGWNVGNVSSMRLMFSQNDTFNQDISGWDVSSVTNMSSMFYDADAFNQDISGWDVSHVGTFEYMFAYADSFNVAIGSWNIFSANNFKGMFYGASSFDQDLGDWNFSNATDFLDFLDNSGMSTSNYDSLLVGLSAYDLPDNKTFGAENINYSTVGRAARQQIETNDNWFFDDGVYDMENHFITTWTTTADNQTITFPTNNAIVNQNFQYDFQIDWGDGTVEYIEIYTSSDPKPTHTYATAGTYTVSVTGNFTQFSLYNTTSSKDNLTSIEQWGDIEWSNVERMFEGASNMTYNATDTPDLSAINRLTSLFRNATSFNGNINNWDVSNITRMSGMFSGATSFNQDISSWDVSNVTNMSYMFAEADSFNQDISNWNVSSITDMTGMFYSAIAFNQNISAWNVGNVGGMSRMFENTESFNQDISSWDVSSVTNMERMFTNAEAFDQNIGNWNVSNVTNFTYFLSGSELSVTNYDSLLTGWSKLDLQDNISFSGGSSQYSIAAEDARQAIIDVNNWSITDGGLSQPFITTWETTSANETITIPTNGLNVSNYEFTIDWGDGNSEIITGDDPDPSHSYSSAGTYTVQITGIFPWLFLNASSDAPKLQTVEQWGDIAWEDMSFAFEGATNMTYNATDTPNLAAVTKMNAMFKNASSFNGDISSWDVSTVTEMNSLFFGASTFNQDIRNWDVSNVTTMEEMFRDASSFNSYLEFWNVSSVTLMTRMFEGATSFNQTLSDWRVDNVTSMNRMFEGATSFDQNLANWSVDNVTDFTGFLAGGELSEPNYRSLLIGWNNLDLQDSLTFDAGNSKYNITGQTAKESIQVNDSWTFSDGGLINYGPNISNSIDDVSLDEDFTEYTLVNLNTVFSDVNAPQDTLNYSLSNSNSAVVNARIESDSLLILSSVSDSTGSATVDVTATDTIGESITDLFTITINPVNDPVSLQQTISDTTAYEDNSFTYTFPGDTFYDIDGDELSYSAVKNNSISLPDWLSFDSNNRTFSGTPQASNVGIDTIQVTANDGNGTSATDTFAIEIIEVNDPVILANSIPDVPGNEDEAFSFTFAENTFFDEDGDELTYTATEKDSSTLPDWLSFEASSRTFSGTPLMEDIGTYTITVTASDGNGTSDSDDFNIIISNTNDAVIVANPIPDTTANEDQEFTFTFSDSVFYDQDGDELTYSAVKKDSSALPDWLSFNSSTRTFSGTPLASDVGVDTIQVTANDGNGTSATDHFAIKIIEVNDPVILANSIPDVSGNEDEAFSFTFSEDTFFDEDGDELTYTATEKDSSALPDWLSFEASTRTFMGTPLMEDIGTYTITVTASDGNGTSDSDDFNIIISNTNDAVMVANPIPDTTANEDQEFTFIFADSVFYDQDGDELTYSAVRKDSSDLPNWLTFNDENRTFSGTPLMEDIGKDTIRVTASDPQGSSVFDEFIITVFATNDEVVLQNPIPDTTALEDEAFSFTFSEDTFFDEDGDELTYTATEKDSSALPDWLSFEASTRTFMGTPLMEDIGTYTITVTASDGNGTSDSDDFNIIISNTNDAVMVANPIPDTTANEDQEFTFIFADSVFYDQDGDELTYSAVRKDSSDLPNWLTFNDENRTFSGTPLMEDIGKDTIRVTASDPHGSTVFDEFIITVFATNDQVVVQNPIPDTTALEDNVFEYTFDTDVFFDEDGDELTYSAIEKDSSSLPSWLGFDAASRTFSGTPLVTDIGTDTIEVTAADGNGSSVIDEFVIQIENFNDAPTVISALSNQTLNEDFESFELARLDTVFTDEESSLDNSLTYSFSVSGNAITASLTDSLITIQSVPDSSGTNELVIQATDTEGETVSDTLEIHVNPVNDNPVPNFALVSRSLTSEGMEVQFADSSTDSKDPDGSILEWDWDFGNDSVSSEQNPSVLFTEEGTYDVKLIVFDNQGTMDSLTKQIDIEFVLTDSISISGGSDVVADFEDLGVYLYFNSISDGDYTITTHQKLIGEEEVPEGISYYLGDYYWSIELNSASDQEPEFQYSISFNLSETAGIDTVDVESMTILKRDNESESWAPVEDFGGVINYLSDRQILAAGGLTSFSDFILASKDLSTSNELLEGIPTEFELSQNYPNPFNPTTTIRFGLPEASEVRLEIFNILGQKVAELVNTKMTAGYHRVNFDASRFSSGMYLYRIVAKDFVQTKKMLLVK